VVIRRADLHLRHHRRDLSCLLVGAVGMNIDLSLRLANVTRFA
jgi:hypothetical protein